MAPACASFIILLLDELDKLPKFFLMSSVMNLVIMKDNPEFRLRWRSNYATRSPIKTA